MLHGFVVLVTYFSLSFFESVLLTSRNIFDHLSDLLITSTTSTDNDFIPISCIATSTDLNYSARKRPLIITILLNSDYKIKERKLLELYKFVPARYNMWK